MRSRFDDALETLSEDLTKMGALCEEIILTAVKALGAGDSSVVKVAADIESQIADKERSIETLCLKLLLQQQPVAGDLRKISAALKMITDMERIGVQALDIAEIIGYLNGRTGSECGDISSEAYETVKMVTGAVDAYVKHDTGLAEEIIAKDDIVDELFDNVKKSLIQMITDNPSNGEYALDLLMIAKYFERIGDHAVNIAGWVIFADTGVHKADHDE